MKERRETATFRGRAEREPEKGGRGALPGGGKNRTKESNDTLLIKVRQGEGAGKGSKDQGKAYFKENSQKGMRRKKRLDQC